MSDAIKNAIDILDKFWHDAEPEEKQLVEYEIIRQTVHNLEQIEHDYILVPRDKVPENLRGAVDWIDDICQPCTDTTEDAIEALYDAAALLAENGGE